MWNCCASRDPKKNKYLVSSTVADKPEWQSATKEVTAPGDNEFEVEVAYVSLSSTDKGAINSAKGIGHSFSGTVKVVGGKLESSDIKKGDKVFGFYKGDTGALSDFIVVAASTLYKVPGNVDLKTAAALPHLAHVAAQLSPAIADGKKVHFSGPKGGYYESLFNAIAKKNKAVAQPNADTLVDFVLHTEGGKSEFKPENYTTAWSFDSAVQSAFASGKQFGGKAYGAEDLSGASKFAQDAGNTDILKSIQWNKDELVSNKETLKAALTKLAAGGHGPILVDVDVLKDLPKKEEPKVEKPVANTADPKTAGQTQVAK